MTIEELKTKRRMKDGGSLALCCLMLIALVLWAYFNPLKLGDNPATEKAFRWFFGGFAIVILAILRIFVMKMPVTTWIREYTIRNIIGSWVICFRPGPDDALYYIQRPRFGYWWWAIDPPVPAEGLVLRVPLGGWFLRPQVWMNGKKEEGWRIRGSLGLYGLSVYRSPLELPFCSGPESIFNFIGNCYNKEGHRLSIQSLVDRSVHANSQGRGLALAQTQAKDRLELVEEILRMMNDTTRLSHSKEGREIMFEIYRRVVALLPEEDPRRQAYLDAVNKLTEGGKKKSA